MPQVDAYISGKVKRFRFFVMAENLTMDIFHKGVFTALHYAMPLRQIRFGVSWYLSD
jgi:hypothetical protein